MARKKKTGMQKLLGRYERRVKNLTAKMETLKKEYEAERSKLAGELEEARTVLRKLKQ